MDHEAILTDMPPRNYPGPISVNQVSTLSWTMDQDALHAAEFGYDGLGLYRPKVDDHGIQETVETLHHHRLRATSLGWAGGFTGIERSFDEAVADGIEAVHQSAEIGAEVLIVLAGGLNRHINTHARRMVVQALQRMGDAAAEVDVQLAIEPIHAGCGDEWSFIDNLTATRDVLTCVAHPNLGFVCDLYHLGLGDGWVDQLSEMTPLVRLVQVGDARGAPMGEMNRCALGEGCVDIAAMLRTVIAAGYQGPIEVELVGEDVERLRYRERLGAARRYMDDILRNR